MPLIDVHAHTVPDFYVTAMRDSGMQDVEGFPMPAWSAPAHLGVMDRQGIDASVLSISVPGVYFAEGARARDLARRVNEGNAELIARYPGRFGAFALLTLPDVDGSLREMEHALDVLKLEGIGLLTNVHGKYLGDPAFDVVFAEANRRRAVVYTHPIAPPHYKDLTLGVSASTLEYPFDTTRMILNLIATGTLRRHPDAKIIVSHGGGTVPFLAERMFNLLAMFNRLDPPLTPGEVLRLMQSLYYDVTGVSNTVSLASYKRHVPAARRLYGSDTPFMPEATIPSALAALRGAEGFAGAELAALEGGNALSLFPRLAGIVRA